MSKKNDNINKNTRNKNGKHRMSGKCGTRAEKHGCDQDMSEKNLRTRMETTGNRKDEWQDFRNEKDEVSTLAISPLSVDKPYM